MTEAEWHISSDPEAMLNVLRGCTVATERKLRLYACICATEAVAQFPKSADYQLILATAEKWAELRANPEEIRAAEEAATAIEVASNRIETGMAAAVSCTLANDAYRGACGVVTDLLHYEWATCGGTNHRRYSDLLRCIFGSPYRGFNVGFRPVTLSPSWRTSTTLALASQMYESRDFGAMPILADALQDAGCDNAEVLYHCRGPGPHVRGCWVVDLVLGKE